MDEDSLTPRVVQVHWEGNCKPPLPTINFHFKKNQTDKEHYLHMFVPKVRYSN